MRSKYTGSTESSGTNSLISIPFVAFSSRAFSSWSVTITYLSLAISKPRTVSLRGTTSSSFGQKNCCFSRTPSFLWSMWKEMPAEDWTAG